MESDSYMVQTFHYEVVSFEFHLPDYFHVTQLFFGSTVGLGVRFIVPSKKQNALRWSRVAM
jgi:hypothetical protein